MTRSKEITIEIGTNYFGRVDEEVLSVIEERMSSETLEFSSRGGRIVGEKTIKRLFTIQSNKIVFFTPFAPILKAILERHGYHPEINDYRQLADLEVDPSFSDNADTEAIQLIVGIQRMPNGVIECDSASVSARMIGIIANAFSDKRIFVAGSTRKKVADAAAAIKEVAKKPVHSVHGGTWYFPGQTQVVVGTL